MDSTSSQVNFLNNKKRGISFIILVISMVVVLVLITVSIIETRRIIYNANLTAFASNLSSIKEEVAKFYFNNGVFPTLNGESNGLVQSELLNKIASDRKNSFIEELFTNGDYDSTDTTIYFYSIDLVKSNISKSNTGLKINGEDDVYYIAYPSMHIYYLKGISAKGQYYFSLEAKLSGVQDISAPTVNTTDVKTSGDMRVVKDKNIWSNDINVYIDVGVSNVLDYVYITMPGFASERRIINLSTGRNYLNFNISKLLNNSTDYFQGLIQNTLTSAEINSFLNTPQADKYIEVIKKYGVTDVERLKISLSNYDRMPPNMVSVNSATIVGSNPPAKLVTLVASDAVSGISSVKYEYLYKGAIKYFEGVSTFDSSYMKNNAKTAKKQSEGTYTMEVPSEVTAISVCIFDKAGNYNYINNISI